MSQYPAFITKRKINNTFPLIAKGKPKSEKILDNDDFDYEQYHKEMIKQQQLINAILQTLEKELPKIQKTGAIDERFGITKSEVDLIQNIAEMERAKINPTLK